MVVRYCTAVALKRHERVNAFNLVSPVLVISPVGWLLKFGDVSLEKPTVAEVPVQLAILFDEFIDEVNGRHRPNVLGKTTRESPETAN